MLGESGFYFQTIIGVRLFIWIFFVVLQENDPRVAMDFTGPCSRIVDDPSEAKAIAEYEGHLWRRRWRPFFRPLAGANAIRRHGLDRGLHVLQPWFHSGAKRELAADLVTDYGTIDG